MGTRDVLMDSGAAWLSAAGGNASAVSEDPSEAALQNKEISIYWTDSCLITLSLCQSTHCMANEYLSLKFNVCTTTTLYSTTTSQEQFSPTLVTYRSLG